MSGSIDFTTLSELAEFLKAFQGATALFRTIKISETCWRLEFTGGY